MEDVNFLTNDLGTGSRYLQTLPVLGYVESIAMIGPIVKMQTLTNKFASGIIAKKKMFDGALVTEKFLGAFQPSRAAGKEMARAISVKMPALVGSTIAPLATWGIVSELDKVATAFGAVQQPPSSAPPSSAPPPSYSPEELAPPSNPSPPELSPPSDPTPPELAPPSDPTPPELAPPSDPWTQATPPELAPPSSPSPPDLAPSPYSSPLSWQPSPQPETEPVPQYIPNPQYKPKSKPQNIPNPKNAPRPQTAATAQPTARPAAVQSIASSH